MTPITIRPFTNIDSQQVGILIADTYKKFNLVFAPPEQQAKLLGPFLHARSPQPKHQQQITQILQAPIVLVAEINGEIASVLRGSIGRLHSLFVSETYHRLGVGTALMKEFETHCRQQKADKITMAATLYAVPFYTAIGYKRSTGIRSMRSFQAHGLQYQPMKKTLSAPCEG